MVSAKALSYLQDPGEPVGLIDAEMMRNISGFLFEAGILREVDGDPLETRPDLSYQRPWLLTRWGFPLSSLL